jgi:hypothetical protein
VRLLLRTHSQRNEYHDGGVFAVVSLTLTQVERYIQKASDISKALTTLDVKTSELKVVDYAIDVYTQPALETYPALEEEFDDGGDVIDLDRFMDVYGPMTFHSDHLMALEACYCVYDVGNKGTVHSLYWEYHEKHDDNNYYTETLNVGEIMEHAANLRIRVCETGHG